MSTLVAPVGIDSVVDFYGENKVVELSKGSCKGDPTWEHESLIVMRNVCGTGLSIQLHHKVAPLFQECLKRAIACAPGYKIKKLGGYCARHQRNDASLPISIHTYGAAFDINWDDNPMNKKLITDLPEVFVAAFTSSGWEWGGAWKSIKDPMHFQFAKGC